MKNILKHPANWLLCLLTFGFLAISSLPARAQTQDTTNQQPNHKRKLSIWASLLNDDDPALKDFSFSMGLTNMLHQGKFSHGDQPFHLKSSVFVGFDFQRPIYIFGKDARTYISTGWGLAWYNFRFANNQTIARTATGIEWQPYNQGLSNVSKSKLTLSTFRLPLQVQFKGLFSADKKGGLNIGLGTYAGFRFQSYTKVKYNNNKIHKSFDNFFTNPFLWGLTADFGFNSNPGFLVFVDWQGSAVFEPNAGPAINPITLGLRLGFE